VTSDLGTTMHLQRSPYSASVPRLIDVAFERLITAIIVTFTRRATPGTWSIEPHFKLWIHNGNWRLREGVRNAERFPTIISRRGCRVSRCVACSS
jgi:hypothetical protein